MADDIDRLLKTIDDAIERGHSPETVWNGVGAIFDAHRPRPLPPEEPSPLEKAQHGTLRIATEDRIHVCVDDRALVLIEEVPGYPMFLQWRCPECAKIKLVDIP